ncbi:hypothetical protein [Paraburkholderia sp. BL23I1N1]|uniref:hypothetical protein n=1 Tax=Paraburkholderia sp. BL23I1N1 TaxID=1938802 RepID=UPI00217D77DF|nr:hypothetical protein [Paraburkholderia sp. BL23I1N1]
MNLLALTAEFESDGHDGHSTLRKLVTVSAVRDLLISKFDISPITVLAYRRVPSLPQLSVLATVAAVSRQPLHRVILGQVESWRSSSDSSARIDVSPRNPRRNWKSIGRKFEKLAMDPACTNVEKACKLVKIDETSAHRHFPDSVARIAQRGKIFRLEKAAAHKQDMLMKMRDAFRTLIADGVYPSFEKIAKMSGVDTRHLDRECVKDLLDEEWKRAEGKTHLTRQGSRNPNFIRDGS